MSLSKRLDITALRTEAERINRIFQAAAVHPFNFSSGRKDDFPGLYFPTGFNRTVRFYNTSQTNMCTGTYNRIMIDYCSTVNQCSPLDPGMRIHNHSLHNKTTRFQSRAWTYDCGWMNHGRHFISLFQQFVCPKQTCFIVAKCRNCCRILRMSEDIITAHPNHILPLRCII